MTTLSEFNVRTGSETDWINITNEVQKAVAASRVLEGICVVFVPHTTAAVTVNENADPDVVHDMLLGLAKAYPDRTEFRHGEGNSVAHLKATAVGSSVTVIISDGKLLLGTWQSVWFCEFDPPRNRKFYIQIIGK